VRARRAQRVVFAVAALAIAAGLLALAVGLFAECPPAGAKSPAPSAADASSPEALCLLLASDDAGVRTEAAQALARLGRPAVPHLLWAFRGGRPDVQEAAAPALGAIGDPAAVPALAEALARSPYVAVRWQATQALAQIGGADAEQALLGALRDRDRTVRLAAVEALGRIATSRAASALRQARRDPDEEVRTAAGAALDHMEGARERRDRDAPP